MEGSPVPYEQRKNNPEFPSIGFLVNRTVAERFWRMSKAREERAVDTFIAAVEALAREMNAAKAAD